MGVGSSRWLFHIRRLPVGPVNRSVLCDRSLPCHSAVAPVEYSACRTVHVVDTPDRWQCDTFWSVSSSPHQFPSTVGPTGAVIPSNTTVQAGTRHSGAPAVLSGSVPAAEASAAAAAADEVATLAAAHAAENAKSAAQVRSEALLTELRMERSQDNLAHMGLLGKEEDVAAAQAAWYEREEREQAEAGGRRQQG